MQQIQRGLVCATAQTRVSVSSACILIYIATQICEMTLMFRKYKVGY